MLKKLFTSVLVAGIFFAITSLVMAGPKTVEPFDEKIWSGLLTEAGKPAIIIFSSLQCTHCPGLIDKISARIQLTKSATRLYVVSIDGNDDTAAELIDDAHYMKAHRLFIFAGSGQKIQYAVNVDWRGMTPYVAYLGGKGKAEFILGEPKEAMLRRWLLGAP